MASTPHLALIGSGRWGSVIKKTLLAMPECELAYEATHDWKTILEKDDVDGVLIATPPHTHAGIALPFIKKGLPVFIEKPLTMNLAEAKQLQEAAEESGSTVMVGHQHLYNPPFIKTKELFTSLGNIRLLVGEGANNVLCREAMWDWSAHDISMMIILMGEMPTSVAAWGVAPLEPEKSVFATSTIKLTFRSGANGLIFSSWLMPQKRKKLTLVGEKKSLVYDDVLPEKKVTLFEENGSKISSPAYDSGMPLTLELQAFVRTITEKEKPLSGIAEGLAIVRILEAAEKSIATDGTPVAVTS
ncbi:Gfo/Idh/MocA family oxidoreductase [Candidatus Kaiserbacteria bacterium]|nr:Gfo/Idh/MocA family oxidoreductase [Candidatus Kaiserbacteria bacterium]